MEYSPDWMRFAINLSLTGVVATMAIAFILIATSYTISAIRLILFGDSANGKNRRKGDQP